MYDHDMHDADPLVDPEDTTEPDYRCLPFPECEWVAYCNNESTGILDHPVIGPVVICDQCADSMNRLDAGDIKRWSSAS